MYAGNDNKTSSLSPAHIFFITDILQYDILTE